MSFRRRAFQANSSLSIVACGRGPGVEVEAEDNVTKAKLKANLFIGLDVEPGVQMFGPHLDSGPP